MMHGLLGLLKAGVGQSGSMPPVFCRPRVWKVLVVVLALCMMGQLSLNLLFYRNYDSLFFVNSTSTTTSEMLLLGPLQNKLQWVSSRMSWMQTVPVITQPNSSQSTLFPSTLIQKMLSEHASQGSDANDNPTIRTDPLKNGTTGSGIDVTNDPKAKVNIGKKKIKGNEKKDSEMKREPVASKPLHEVSRGLVLNMTSSNSISGVLEGNNNRSSSSATHTTEKPICPPVPPNLVGPLKIVRTAPTLEEQEKAHPELEPGGHFRPPACHARHKVAVVIPYRDRVLHLSVFLNHIHPILQRQQVDYAIFVVEQAGSEKFNRAMLMNVGALEALRQYQFSCFIFHDVDLLPEDDRNLYTCPEQPRHMSIAINVMKYKLPYNDIFGGVSAMTVDQFRAVNGFSNKFWGWGGEDDDMSNRIKFNGFFISRYPANIGRYTMLTHKKDKPNPKRYQYLHGGQKRIKSDGLTSIKYRVLDIQLRRLYTWLYIELQPS